MRVGRKDARKPPCQDDLKDLEGDRVELPEGHEGLVGLEGCVGRRRQRGKDGGDKVRECESYGPCGNLERVNEEVGCGIVGRFSIRAKVCGGDEEMDEEVQRLDCTIGDDLSESTDDSSARNQV